MQFSSANNFLCKCSGEKINFHSAAGFRGVSIVQNRLWLVLSCSFALNCGVEKREVLYPLVWIFCQCSGVDRMMRCDKRSDHLLISKSNIHHPREVPVYRLRPPPPDQGLQHTYGLVCKVHGVLAHCCSTFLSHLGCEIKMIQKSK